MFRNRVDRRRLLKRSPLFAMGMVAAWQAACGGSSSESGSPGSSSGGGTVAAPESSLRTFNEDGRGGTLRVGMTASNIPIPNTPVTEGGEGNRFVGRNIYNGLIHENVSTNNWPTLEPGLAETWSMAPDQVTWTFNLRKGVKFHDGSDFNAEAVAFQWRRVADRDFEFYDSVLAGQISSTIRMIKNITASDEYTVKLETKAPYAFLFYDLIQFYIPSMAAIRKYGNKEYPKYAAGTGPFRITKYVDGQVMEMAPNETYWRGKPKLDKLVIMPMPEPATRLAALQAGDVDWAELPPPDALRQLRASNFQIVMGPYPHVNTYWLNLLEGPLTDVRIRQAINYAIDKPGTAALINGVGMPAAQLVPEGHPWYDPAYEGYSYNAERAKQLLSEAGASGLKLKLLYPSGGSGNMFPGPMNEKMQADFRAVGIDLEIVPTEWETIRSMRTKGFGAPEMKGYHILHNSWSTNNPSFSLTPFLTSSIPPAGVGNGGGYKSPKADELWTKASQTFDEAEQNKLLREMQSTVMKDAAVLNTLHDLNLRVFSPKVQGFVQPQSWSVDLTQVWVKG